MVFTLMSCNVAEAQVILDYWDICMHLSESLMLTRYCYVHLLLSHNKFLILCRSE